MEEVYFSLSAGQKESGGPILLTGSGKQYYGKKVLDGLRRVGFVLQEVSAPPFSCLPGTAFTSGRLLEETVLWRHDFFSLTNTITYGTFNHTVLSTFVSKSRRTVLQMTPSCEAGDDRRSRKPVTCSWKFPQCEDPEMPTITPRRCLLGLLTSFDSYTTRR